MYQLSQQQPLNYRSYVRLARGMAQKPIAQTSSALILTLLTIAFFGFAAIRPTLATVSELIGELEEKQEIFKKVEQKNRALGKAQETFLEYQDILGSFDVALPEELDAARVIFAIEYLAYQNQVTLTSLRLDPVTIYGQPSTSESQKAVTPAGTDFASLSLRLNGLGELDNLKNFTQQLDRYNRLLQVEFISLELPEEDEVSGYVFSVRLNFYWTPADPAYLPTKTKPSPRGGAVVDEEPL